MIKEVAGYKTEYQINKFKNLVDSKFISQILSTRFKNLINFN